MAASTVYCFTSALPALFSSFIDKTFQLIRSPSFNSFKPIFTFKLSPSSIRIHRSKFSSSAAKLARRVFTVDGLVDGDSVTDPEPDFDSEAGATIDLGLPRRGLLVQFTCDLCGERTKRLINRLAYERGVVFVQCAGCLRHHKSVDNLGLITEYDFREETNMD